MNLNTLLTLSKVATLVAVCFMCIAVGELASKAAQVVAHTNTTLSQIDTVSANLNKTLDTVNRPGTGTLAEANKTLLATKDTLVHVDMIANHENQQLSHLDDQERMLYSDLHSTLSAGQMTLTASTQLIRTTNDTVAGIQPVLTQTQDAAGQLVVTVGNVNKLVTDPAIFATLSNIQDTTKATTGTMQSVQATSSEVHDAVHKYLHPSWVRSTANWTLNVVRAVNPF